MMINEATIKEVNQKLEDLSFYNEWYSKCCNGNLFGLAAVCGLEPTELPRSLHNFLKDRGQELSASDIKIIKSISEVEIILPEGRFDRKLHCDFIDNRNYIHADLDNVTIVNFGFKTANGDIVKKAYFIAK